MVGCANVKVTGRRELAPVPEVTPSIIYVADFSLDPKTMTPETGLLPLLPVTSPKSDESDTLFPRLVGVPVEHSVRARELVQLMTDSIVEDLRTLGLNASRLTATGQALAEGWLVRGTFIHTDEGNRLKRALVGFGDGKTELQMLISLDELGAGTPRPFCEVGTTARSSSGPGALISIDPYDALGRFMIGGLDLDKNVMETARRIARAIDKTIQHHNCSA
ncbi:MAG: DUF4410 domain-containing protein [Deltaproteobacteria bacterium]|nr:DUF4410 domain-containing protein [Deltaproteobacteria bacterium]